MTLMNKSQVYEKISRTQWIKRFVCTRLPNFLIEYSDDVCQEVGIKLIHADKRQGQEIDNYGYIKQTAMSVMIDFMRKHKNNQYHDSYDNQMHDKENPLDNPEEKAHNQRVLEQINAIILTLPDRCQSILLLYLRGLKINEIVELTGNKKATVRNDIYRGKEKLLNALKSQGIQYEI